jgi:hypothetical protein
MDLIKELLGPYDAIVIKTIGGCLITFAVALLAFDASVRRRRRHERLEGMLQQLLRQQVPPVR